MQSADFKTAVADETLLRASLEESDIAPLLMVLVQLTGDLALLDEVAPYIDGPWSFMERVPAELKGRIRDRLVDTLKAYAEEGRQAPAVTQPALLKRLMSAGVGQPVSDEYLPLLVEEMQFGGRDERSVPWRHLPATADLKDFRVVVIGAGFSGLCMGIRLAEQGIPFVILEKNPDVGGTWLENTYPDCAVDTPNHFYSYSFHPNNDWTHHFSKQPEILAYIQETVQRYDLRKHIRFGVEVERAAYDEESERWQLHLKGEKSPMDCKVLVTAVGLLNRPAVPPIPGIDSFAGPRFHTAQWRHDVKLEGQRVAMIGTGASGMQAGPAIAPMVASLTVFQRSPHWAMNNPNYHREVTTGMRWSLNHIPFLSQWLRFQLFWASSDGFHAQLKVDPAWPHPERSLNAQNDQMRERLVRHIESELEGRPDLIAKCTPAFPPYGKRMLRDNHWYRMLRRENVSLETGVIDHVEPDAIVMRDGTRHATDVMVMATGFQASKVLWPMDIRGKGGVSIRDIWGDDDPRAHLGMNVPGFPNLFVSFGPGTNLAHGGSAIFHFECQVRYIQQALREMIESGITSLEVRRDVHDQYNEQLDRLHRDMVWAHPGVKNWYKNARNRVTLTSPWRLLDYWALTREFRLSDFSVRRRGAETPRPHDHGVLAK